MRFFYIFILSLFVFFPKPVFAGDGMWLPFLIGQLNEAEMKEMGMKIGAEDIYSVNEGSLKDAIVHFGGFCSSEIISPNGLLLTNHHCGYGQIQAHSTLENNYLEDGFWAASFREELPNKDLFATLILKIEDITSLVLDSMVLNSDADSREVLINKNLEVIKNNYALRQHESMFIRPFYYGNQYILFVTETYRDVRLVGTPPSSIGKFGADTDNWVWPRHTGDFALFRIYADENNMPSEYSENNRPYVPRHFLPVSIGGVEDGDFTMVFGFPGRTEQYLPAVAVQNILENINPARIEAREKTLEILDKHMRKNEAARLKYASKHARIANHWKKWIGESLGLRKSNAVQKKLDFESEFNTRIAQNDTTFLMYNQILPQFTSQYNSAKNLMRTDTYYGEIFQRNIEAFIIASSIQRYHTLLREDKTDQAMAYKERLIPGLESRFKDYDKDIDFEVATQLLQLYVERIPQEHLSFSLRMLKTNPQSSASLVRSMYRSSFVTDLNRIKDILNQDKFSLSNTLENDALMTLFKEIDNNHIDVVLNPLNEIRKKIDKNQADYMKALLETFPDKRFFPDANGTMRIAYGYVEGYYPKDAVYYNSVTYLDGVMEKYIPGDYEFDLPQKLIDLYHAKDYGPYAVDGRLPVNFIASNHTTGGNSGSPAIDAHGNLIGVNFDRVWEGTMSDINYDRSICRNIMVDTRYILFVIDKFANAQRLIDEISIVSPKR